MEEKEHGKAQQQPLAKECTKAVKAVTRKGRESWRRLSAGIGFVLFFFRNPRSEYVESAADSRSERCHESSVGLELARTATRAEEWEDARGKHRNAGQ